MAIKLFLGEYQFFAPLIRDVFVAAKLGCCVWHKTNCGVYVVFS